MSDVLDQTDSQVSIVNKLSIENGWEHSYPEIDSDPTNRQIRLVELLPGEGENLVECKFHVRSLNDHPEYESLSYVWGDHNITHLITVDGHPFQITTNLLAVLRQLRKPVESRVLWIDAICIDQTDIAEKSQQVNMMSSIYSGASLGLIWLGDYESLGLKPAHAEAAFEVIRKMANDVHIYEMPFFTEEGYSTYNNAFAAWYRINNSPWWWRTWTVQEIILPPTVMMLCGPLSLPWSTWCTASSCIIHHSWSCCRGVSLGKFGSRVDRHTALSTSVQWLREDRSHQHPLDIMWRYRDRQASDPRDKVFALLSLLPQWSSQELYTSTPNYSLSLEQVYRNVALDLIRFDKGLKSLICHRGEMPMHKNIPSWVTDWSWPVIDGSAQPWMHQFRYGWFQADNNLDVVLSTEDLDDSTIALDGLQIDVISTLGQPILSSHDDDTYSFILDWRGLAMQRAGSSLEEASYIGGGTWLDAFWQSLMGGLMADEGDNPVRRAKPEDEQLYRAYIEGNFDDSGGFDDTVTQFLKDQTFFITRNGYMGIGPRTLREGDEVWILFGGHFPFALRRVGDIVNGAGEEEVPRSEGLEDARPRYKKIGDFYVHGIMQGEAMEGYEEKRRTVLLQ